MVPRQFLKIELENKHTHSISLLINIPHKNSFLKIEKATCMACKNNPFCAAGSTCESGTELVVMAAAISTAATATLRGVARRDTVGHFDHFP